MYSVVKVDPADPAVKDAVLSVLREAFGTFQENVYRHILTSSPIGTVLYCIYDSDNIVAVNAFIAHSVQRAGITGIAYQSCITATRNDQKGRGHFSRIINFAKHDLNKLGGAFIFGFPNHNSGPIFVNKLRFSISNNAPCFFANFANIGIGRFDEKQLLSELSNQRRIYFDIHETADWKRAKDGANFFEFEHLTNYLFGRTEEREKFGFKFRILVVGGYEINKPLRFNAFLVQAKKKSETHLIRINANSHGPVAIASGFSRAETLTEPTIAFPLNWEVDAKDIEACGGLKDVY